MSWSTALNAVSTLAVVSGVWFAIVEMRRFRHQRVHDSAVQLVTAFQTSDFQEAIHIVVMLPEGLSKPEIVARLGPDARFVHLFLTRLEGIGMLVGRREIAIDHVADLISGPVVIGWRKLCRYVEDERAETGSVVWLEWVQWLAERIEEQQTEKPKQPAYLQHRDWKP